MPKKLKKGGGRTEEERLVQLQQRAQAEEEMAKKKEETLTLFLKDKLQKEQRNATVNLLKLSDGWRTILRQTRAAELRKDVTVLRPTFERQLEDLNSIVQKQLRELQEAERQAALLQRDHLQHVERLLAQQDQGLTGLQQQWEDGLQELSVRFGSDRRQLLAHFQQQRVKLQDQILSTEQQHATDMDQVEKLYRENLAMYASASGGTVPDSEELKATARSIEALKLSIHEASASIDSSVNHERRDRDVRRLEALQDQASRLREDMLASKTENESMERDLTAGRTALDRKCHELRDQLSRARTSAKKQLTELAVQGDTAAKKLQAVITKGEKVLRVAEVCCKLQSNQDILSSSSPSSRPTQKEVGEFPALQQLTQRLNAALLHREALRKHRQDLSRENGQLELLLQQLDDALDGHRAPLAVSQAPTSTDPPAADRRHPIIEAVYAVQHSL